MNADGGGDGDGDGDGNGDCDDDDAGGVGGDDDGDDGDDGDGDDGDVGTELVLLPASLIRQRENNLHLGILSVPLSSHQKDLQRFLPQKPFNDL